MSHISSVVRKYRNEWDWQEAECLLTFHFHIYEIAKTKPQYYTKYFGYYQRYPKEELHRCPIISRVKAK